METKIKILLIEDSVDDAELIKRKLEKSTRVKWVVTISRKLNEALTLAKKTPPDIILTDLGLPDSHGLDTVTKILLWMPHIPLVVLSGFDDDATALKAVQSGAQDYLVKGRMDTPKWEQTLIYSLERARLRDELERNTEEISKLHNNLLTILEKSADAVLVVNHEKRILYANHAVEAIFARRPREMFNLPFQYPLDAGKTYEVTIHRADEKTTTAETTVAHISWEGRPVFLVSMHDITQRKAMEEALLASEEKYRSIFELAQDGVITVNLQGDITSCNEAFARMGGVSITEIIGKHFSEIPFVIPKDIAYYAKLFSTMLNTGALPPLEIAWPHIDGTTRTVELRAGLMKQNGKISGIQAMVLDITERKRMEKALIDEGTRRRILIEQSRDGIVILDIDGNVYDANQRFAEMLGYTMDEVKKLHVFDWEFLYTKERVLEMIRNVDEKGDHFTTQHERKDGSIYDVEISTNAAIFAGQKLIFCVCRDITEQKRVEKSLKDSEEKFSKAFMNSPQAIAITDLEKGIILEANETFIKFTGASRKDLIGKKAIDLDLWNSPEEREAIIRTLKEKSVVKNYERQFRTKTGELHTWLFSAEIINIDNKPCMLSVTVDITERKKTEELLRYSDIALRSIHEGIFATNNDFIVTRWNETCERMFGTKAVDAIGKSISDLLTLVEEYPGQNEKRANKLLKNGINREEQMYRTPRGDVWVDAQSQIMEDNGQRTGWVTLISDITERKKAEEALKVSEEKYRELINTSTDAIVSTDSKMNIVIWNHGAERIFQYTEQEMLGQSVLKLVPEMTHGNMMQSYTQAKTIGKSSILNQVVEQVGVRKDSMKIPIELTISIRRVSNSFIATAIIRDITVRKEAEKALAQSEEKYRELINTSTDAIISVDSQMNITIWNQGAERIFGYTEKEMLGHSVLTVIPTRKAGEGTKEFFRLTKVGSSKFTSEITETIGLKKNGSEFPLEVSVSTRKVGDTYTITIIMRDVSIRVKALEALKESEEKYREIINTSSDAIISINSKMDVVIWNHGAEKLFGYKENEAMGLSIITFFPKSLHKAVAGEIVNLKRNGVSQFFNQVTETTGLRKNCTEVPIEVSVSTRKIENDLMITMIIRDIAIRKEAEAKLKQIDQMKTEFLSNVSHELRTPLQSITGFTKLILNGKVPDPAVQQEFLQIIDRETMHLGNLINGLLDMSRLDVGRFQIYKKLVPVADVFKESLEMFHSLAREKEITLNELFPAHLPEMEIDGERIRQVVINLLGNALKFSDPGSSINVRAAVHSNELLFQVIDHGIGIQAESMSHLFERFYRSEGEKVRGGTGLGLYISKQIIEAHGGRIWAESKFGEGSTFSFTLPLNNEGGKQNDQENTDRRRRPGHPKTGRVLAKARGLSNNNRV
jgi:PAS domain S-box-containing protein